jgi:PAS domain S-box-containing protein
MEPQALVALDWLGVWVLELDLDSTVTYANPACLAQVELEVRGRDFCEALLPPAEMPGVRTQLQEIVRRRGGGRFESTWLTRDGPRHVVSLLTVSPEERLWLVGVDITELRGQLDAVISITADAIISLDAQMRICLYNEGAELIFGWTSEEALGQPLDLLLPPPLRGLHHQHMLRFAAGPVRARRKEKRGHEIVGMRKDGEVFPAEAAISKIEVAGGVLFTVILQDISERKAAEQERERLTREIDAERRWLRAVLELAPLGVFLSEPDGRRYANRRAEELLGVRMTPAPGGGQGLLYPDGQPVPHERHIAVRAQRGETVLGEEYLVQRPDGTQLPVLGSAAPLRDDDGQVTGTIGVFQDMSDRMAAEEALRLSEARLRVSLAGSPVLLWSQDAELRYTWVHNPHALILGEQVLGKTDHDLLSREEADKLAQLKREVLQTGRAAREVMKATVDGKVSYYDTTVEPLRDSAGQVVGVTCAAWDVTERQREEVAQRFLAEAGRVLMSAATHHEATLRALAQLAVRELADWFIVELFEEGQIRRVKVAHSSPEGAQTARMLETFPLDRQRPHLTALPLYEQRPMLLPEIPPGWLESVSQSPQHAALLSSLQAESLLIVPMVARGRALGTLVAISSRPERRYDARDARMFEQLAQLAALAVDNAQLYATARRAVAARDEVLCVVAHDLRNPVFGTRLGIRGLLARPREERERDLLQKMERALERANHMLDDLLDSARLESGQPTLEPEPVAPASLVREAVEAVEALASEASLGLQVVLPEPLPEVLADRRRVLQIFSNLLGNAIKFTPAGGTVRVGGEAKEDEVCFSVEDTGPGITAEQLPHLFERFWQAKRSDRRGLGLGLPIAKELVEAHGGHIWAESTPGRGGALRFTLPIAPRSSARRVS